jgi:hypothetical protein
MTWHARLRLLPSWLRAAIGSSPRHLVAMVRADWRDARHFPLLVVLVASTSLVLAAYASNHPQPVLSHDSPSYLADARQIATSANPVNPERMPGYPLLIAVVFQLAGQGNYGALYAAQATLHALATLEVYALAFLIFRRRWIAFACGLLVGPNAVLLALITPVLTEGLGLWLVVSLALSATLFVRSLRPRDLWLTAGCALALFMTRPEWYLLPLPLFAYLLCVAARRGALRRQIPHAAVAGVVLYALLGAYVATNVLQNQYMGITYIQNVNLMGKVIQYRMVNEAPPQYAEPARVIAADMAHGVSNPYAIANLSPAFKRDHYALFGDVASAIIRDHPVEFIVKSISVAFRSLASTHARSQIDPRGQYFAWLSALRTLDLWLVPMYQLFPFCAMLWAALLIYPRTRRLRMVEMACGVALITLYGLAMTTLGGYESYDRLHTPFDPLMAVVIVGTLLTGVRFLPRVARHPRVQTNKRLPVSRPSMLAALPLDRPG